jgi:hypothetical protein
LDIQAIGSRIGSIDVAKKTFKFSYLVVPNVIPNLKRGEVSPKILFAYVFGMRDQATTDTAAAAGASHPDINYVVFVGATLAAVLVKNIDASPLSR